jgi:hypothetical protein
VEVINEVSLSEKISHLFVTPNFSFYSIVQIGNEKQGSYQKSSSGIDA